MENMNKYLKYKILKENVNRIFTNIKLLEIDGAFNQKRGIYIHTRTHNSRFMVQATFFEMTYSHQ